MDNQTNNMNYSNLPLEDEGNNFPLRSRGVVSKHRPLNHYRWGNNCDGWNLVEELTLSVKQERMTAGTEETLHYHQQSQQFFFILKGDAIFEIENAIIMVHEKEGIHIKAGKKHRVMNKSTEDLEFLLCSQPSIINDKFNCI